MNEIGSLVDIIIKCGITNFADLVASVRCFGNENLLKEIYENHDFFSKVLEGVKKNKNKWLDACCVDNEIVDEAVKMYNQKYNLCYCVCNNVVDCSYNGII